MEGIAGAAVPGRRIRAATELLFKTDQVLPGKAFEKELRRSGQPVAQFGIKGSGRGIALIGVKADDPTALTGGQALGKGHEPAAPAAARALGTDAKGVDDQDLFGLCLDCPGNGAVLGRLDMVEVGAAQNVAVDLVHIEGAVRQSSLGGGTAGVDAALPVGPMAAGLLFPVQYGFIDGGDPVQVGGGGFANHHRFPHFFLCDEKDADPRWNFRLNRRQKVSGS